MTITIEDIETGERFMNERLQYLEDHQNDVLKNKYTKGTVHKHAALISYCIDHMNAYYSIKGFEEIDPGKCGSKMVTRFNTVSSKKMQTASAKKVLLSFFLFIYEKYGIANQKLIRDLSN